MTETDRKLRVRLTEIGAPAGERHLNAVEPIRPNLLRLEHELQTVVDGSALSRRDYSERSRYQRRPGSTYRCRRVRCAVSSGCPAPLRASGSLLHPNRWAHYCAGTDRKLRPPSPANGSHRGGRARCPDGTQPEPFDRQPYLLKAAGTELASRLQHLPAGAPFSFKRAGFGAPP